MARYAIFRISDGYVPAFCEWNGDTAIWQPESGYDTIQRNDGAVGDTWTGSAFMPGVPVPTPYAFSASRKYNGTAVLDFGAAKLDAEIFVSQPDIATGCYPEVWLTGSTMSDNDADAHLMANGLVDLTVSNVAAGSGFTILGLSRGGVVGTFRVRWARN